MAYQDPRPVILLVEDNKPIRCMSLNEFGHVLYDESGQWDLNLSEK